MGDTLQGVWQGGLFGISVSMDGTMLAVGAWAANDDNGAVKVYSWNNSAWEQVPC